MPPKPSTGRFAPESCCLRRRPGLTIVVWSLLSGAAMALDGSCNKVGMAQREVVIAGNDL